MKIKKLLVIFFLPCVVFSQSNTDRIEVRVNGDIITESDINKAIARRVFYLNLQYKDEEDDKKLEEEIKKVREEAVQNLINKKMVLFEFQERGYQLPPSAVDQQINNQIEQYAGGNKEEYFRLLERENLSIDEIKEFISDDTAVNIMYNTFVFGKINIGPQRKKRYYEANKKHFTGVDRVEVQAFIIKRSNYDTDKEFEDRLIQLSTLLKQSNDFTEMVRKNNEEDGAAEDGSYGWINLPELNKEFREKMSPLKKGETLYEPAMSKIGDDRFAYFFHMKDREDGKLAPYSEVENKINNILRQEKGKPLLKSYLAGLRNKSAIEIFNE